MKSILILTLLFAPFLVIGPAKGAQSLSGLWDATVNVDGVVIPFRMELSQDGQAAKGWFFNGDEKVISTSGRFDGGKLILEFNYYGSKLEASFKDGALAGTYFRNAKYLPFEAKPFAPSSLGEGDVPSIAGFWEIEAKPPAVGPSSCGSLEPR